MDASYLITAAHERTTCHIEETHVLRHLLPSFKFCRLDVAVDFHVPLRWAHVLPKRNDVYINLA